MIDNKQYQQAIEKLNSTRNYHRDKWAIFFLGSQLSMGKTRIYASRGTALKRIVDEIAPYPVQVPYPRFTNYKDPAYTEFREKQDKENKLARQKGKDIAEKLIESKMLEIRKLGDRSPRFPHNVADLPKEQADRLVQMLDAPDKEMVNLAITVLQNMNNDTKTSGNNVVV